MYSNVSVVFSLIAKVKLKSHVDWCWQCLMFSLKKMGNDNSESRGRTLCIFSLPSSFIYSLDNMSLPPCVSSPLFLHDALSSPPLPQVSSLLGDPSRLLMQKALSLRPPGLVPLGKGLLGDSPTGEQRWLTVYPCNYWKLIRPPEPLSLHLSSLSSAIIRTSHAFDEFRPHLVSVMWCETVCHTVCLFVKWLA